MVKLFVELCGAACMFMGLACIFSSRFLEVSLRSTAVGDFWKTAVGDRFGAVASRFLYGLVQIGLGALLFLFAYGRY